MTSGRPPGPGWGTCTAQAGDSRTTSSGLLSPRSPRNRGCRSIPSLVHSVNATCATSAGSTQCAVRSRTGSANGDGSPASARPAVRAAPAATPVAPAGADLAGVPQRAGLVVVAEQQGAEADPGAGGSVKPPTTNSWPAEHLSFSQSGERRGW